MLANKYGLQLTIIIAVAVALSLVLLGLFIYDIYQEGLLASSVPQCQTLPAYQLNTRTPIKHVIIIFLENHSFDNIFGVYPNNGTLVNSLVSQLTVPNNLLTMSKIPNYLRPAPMGIYYTRDPNEGYIPYHADWDYGKMDGWVWGSGPQSLYYYTVDQVAPLWDLAEEYGLADNYFTPYLSESAPNHLFLYAAYAPVIDDYGPPPYIPVQESVFAELCQYHVSWGGYYVDPRESPSFLDIKYFYGISKYSSHIQTWSDFISEVMNGSLPAVSWVMPDPSTDMGPPGNILYGEAWLLYIINTVEESPIWNSTVIFITWDEFGGYYDHVPPPIINGKPLGVRVPLIVISPYAKEDYVSHTLLTHASLIAFIDYNWGLPALNKYVLESNIPLDFFYFNMSREPIIFSQEFPLIGNVYLLPNVSNYEDLSTLYPLTPQIPLDELPYPRYGYSNITLAELGSTVYVSEDFAYVPVIYTPLFLWLIIALTIDLASASLLPIDKGRLNALPVKVLGIVNGSVITASVTGLITLTTGFLNYLGNTGEAPPLLLGYLIGLVLFPMIGMALTRIRGGGAYIIVLLSIIVPVLLYLLIYVQAIQSFLMSDEPLLIYGLSSTAPAMLITLLFLRNYMSSGRWVKGFVYALSLGLLSYLLILVIALVYIRLYQPGLSTLLLPTELLGLSLTIAWFVTLTRSPSRGGDSS